MPSQGQGSQLPTPSELQTRLLWTGETGVSGDQEHHSPPKPWGAPSLCVPSQFSLHRYERKRDTSSTKGRWHLEQPLPTNDPLAIKWICRKGPGGKKSNGSPSQHSQPAQAGSAGGAKRWFLSHRHMWDLDCVILKGRNNLGEMPEKRASSAVAERSQQA